jgi:hypothetical protein
MSLLLLLCGLFHANAFIVTVRFLLFALFQLGTLKIFIRYITKITLKFNLTPLLVLKITRIAIVLYQTNTIRRIFLVLAHWKNSPWVDMLLNIILILSKTVFALSPYC